MGKGTQRERCSLEGCEGWRKGLGFCVKHYRRFRLYGDPLGGPRIYNDTPARIRSYIIPDPSGCWEWGAHHDEKGYGRLNVTGATNCAHRLVWELENGPVPAGMELDHLCRNRGCVNPAHLEPVPHKVNTARGVGPTALNAAKVTCKYGHPFDEANTIVRPDRPNTRECRACKRRDRNNARAARARVA